MVRKKKGGLKAQEKGKCGMEKNVKRSMGKRMNEVRKAAGLSQEEAAEAADIATVTISRAERGIYMLNMATMFKLAEACGVTMSRLCEGL